MFFLNCHISPYPPCSILSDSLCEQDNFDEQNISHKSDGSHKDISHKQNILFSASMEADELEEINEYEIMRQLNLARLKDIVVNISRLELRLFLPSF